ncbi:protein-tyrosine phosphatase-like protein [Boletus edulis]|uniref:protein-tyrosine-phosphatase n=1 Tax=Boletus edulis BED1 TaxID=1328754 RepID=A0AAD4BUA4_BOLED|nr:protein-tyrosine phosphatase-like protein [Boletus edulis]KAF8439677.1 protein-tyrosine phosphatase-like protein [Boletus edulis BED1]
MPKIKVSKAKANSAQSTKATPDSVSLILPYLYIGPCSATSSTSTFLARQGITHIISVGKKPNSTRDGITYLRLTIEDNPSADLSKACTEATAFIDQARGAKNAKPSKIFVHCSAGISRSPAVVAFYLMQRCDMSLRRALGLIVRARPNACPNYGFVVQLKQAEVDLRGSSSLPPDLMFLPSKKEERLAFLEEDPQLDDGNVESSKSASMSGNIGKQHGKFLRRLMAVNSAESP